MTMIWLKKEGYKMRNPNYKTIPVYLNALFFPISCFAWSLDCIEIFQIWIIETMAPRNESKEESKRVEIQIFI